MVCKLRDCCGLSQRTLEIELEHDVLSHYINDKPKINQSVWENGVIDVHIYYRASKVQIL